MREGLIEVVQAEVYAPLHARRLARPATDEEGDGAQSGGMS